MYKLEKLNWRKWLHNSLVFLAPVAIIYLVFLQGNLGDGFSWSDFVPSEVVIGSMVLYVVNVLLDFLRKYREA